MDRNFYIETQIKSLFINKVLLLNDTKISFNILTSSYELLSLIDVIDSYLSFNSNLMFLQYFDDARNKLEEILELCLFKLNSIEDEELADEFADTQYDIIQMINSLYTKVDQDYNQIENLLLLGRGVDKDISLNKKEFLRKCYATDYDVSLYLNSNNSIQYVKEIYPIVLMSSYYYFNNIAFTYDQNLTKTKLEELLNYQYSGNSKEYIEKFKKVIERAFEESLDKNFDDFINEEFKDDKNSSEERVVKVKKCQIYDFEKSKAKILKKREKGE